METLCSTDGRDLIFTKLFCIVSVFGYLFFNALILCSVPPLLDRQVFLLFNLSCLIFRMVSGCSWLRLFECFTVSLMPSNSSLLLIVLCLIISGVWEHISH